MVKNFQCVKDSVENGIVSSWFQDHIINKEHKYLKHIINKEHKYLKQ
jgi:hypothetical protein